MSCIPEPLVRARPINQEREALAISEGLSPLVARVVAARPYLAPSSPKALLAPRLNVLDNPCSLPDIEKAAQRLLQAFKDNEVIGIETDHDCDGQTSHAVIYIALTEHFGYPKERIRSYIGHRLKEGYGLSESVMGRILSDSIRPSLIITADNGSSDEAQIRQLKAQGIDVIVTDHHAIPTAGIPESAFAVINPLREDSAYPDKCIAGCMVAWLLMAYTRQQWMQSKPQSIPSLASLLDYVAVGTVADCVSMARSKNNRAVVAYGMRLIMQRKRPCWNVLLEQFTGPITSEDLAFKIAPLLNSDGRLSCAFGSVSFLLSEDTQQAGEWVAYLQEQNSERKTIQEKITHWATVQATEQYRQNKKSICVLLEEGHAGVHGISASRIKDLFGRPVIIFCPKQGEPELLTGSGRSIEALNLSQALQKVAGLAPDLLVRFGGHQGAAGLTIYRKHLSAFEQCFEQVVDRLVPAHALGPVIYTDGSVSIDTLTIHQVQLLLQTLEPFGREFEPPCFEARGILLSLTPMGATQTHARLGLVIDEIWMEAVWFCAKSKASDPWPVSVGQEVKIVYTPKLNTYRGKTKMASQIVYITSVVESTCGI